MSSSKKILSGIIFGSLAIAVGIFVFSFFLEGSRAVVSYFSEAVNKICKDSPCMQGLSLHNQTAAVAMAGEMPENLPIEIRERIGYFIKNYEKEAKSGAESFLVGDLDTGEIIFEKNTEVARPIASVSKLMTALVTKENYSLEETKISKKALATYGSPAGFTAGEPVALSTLLYPLLLESSNPVAEAIAEHSGRNEFLRDMNEKTYELGMKNTFYQDPSGLSSKNVSTVLDLFKLSRYIWQNHPEIFAITREPRESRGRHAWYNNNKLIYQKSYLGGKSGYTDEARKTGVALFNVPVTEDPAGRNLAFITLKSEDRFRDTMALVAFARSNIFYGEESRAASFVPIEARTDPNFKNWVDLVFVGDIMLDRGVRNSVEKNFGGDYYSLFDQVKEIEHADIAFGNLEGPVSLRGTDSRNLYSFRMSPEVIPVLARAGFDALSVANNHIGDWGREAFLDTLKQLDSTQILPVGAGANSGDAEQPKIIEKNGLKIGFLGFTDVGPESLAAGNNSPGQPAETGILLVSNPCFAEIIQNASREVDALIVSIHWGEEYQKPTARMRELAHIAIDSGAKIIAGHHPHIAQETEEYEGGLIIYSLGNFIFDQAFSDETMQGLMVELGIRHDGLFKIKKKTVKLDEKFKPSEIISQ